MMTRMTDASPRGPRSPLARLVSGIGVVLAAALFLFEEFGWKLLMRGMQALARLPVVARLEIWIAGLGPYPALALFLVPIALLEPLKLLALWLLASGHVLLGLGAIIFAKFFSTALVGRLFYLCRPALLSLHWFRAAYEWTMATRERLYARVKVMPAWQAAERAAHRAKLIVSRLWQRLGAPS